MSETNPKVDAFLKRAKKWQEEMSRLRMIILSCGLKEELKWGKPFYTCQETNVLVIWGFKEQCALGFCKGALLKDAKGILVQPGENSQAMRKISFSSLGEIVKMDPILKAYIREVIEIEKAGLEIKYKTISEFSVPEELESKLEKSPVLKTAFQALTPGRRRAYFLYISAAKQSATRAARVEKCVPQILAGKGIDDDYRSKRK